MAAAFDQVDFVIAATNPSPAFAADAADEQPERELRRLGEVEPGRAARLPRRSWAACARSRPRSRRCRRRCSTRSRARFPDLVQMGGLTIISNIYGNPAVSIPGGLVDGLPVGMQVLARHHADALLFDVALAVERDTPWPLGRARGARMRRATS